MSRAFKWYVTRPCFGEKKIFVYDVTVRACKIYMWSKKKLATYFSKILRCCLFPKNHNIACNIRCTRHLIRLHYPLHYSCTIHLSVCMKRFGRCLFYFSCCWHLSIISSDSESHRTAERRSYLLACHFHKFWLIIS